TSSTHFLCFLIILVTTPFLNPTQAIRQERNPTNTDFIKTSCKVATFPDLCYHSLSTYASDIQTSPKLLADTALSVTITTMQTAL
ncbi:pectinesterase inhibitor domain-containing protein, partial [Mycobacterium kansasii]